jgi:hypothetical protein
LLSLAHATAVAIITTPIKPAVGNHEPDLIVQYATTPTGTTAAVNRMILAQNLFNL